MSNIWCKHRRVSIGGLSWSAWLCSTCPLSSRLDLASSLGSLSTVFQNGENGSHKAFQGQHLATAVFVKSIHKACSDGWPSKCPYRQAAGGWKRALQWWLCPLCATQQWHLLLWWPRLLPLDFPVCGAPYSRRCCFTATAVPSLGLLSKPHFPAPSPALYQETHNSGWSVQGSSTDHEHSSLSCRPQTSCCVPLDHERSPSVPVAFPTGRVLLWVAGTSPHLQLPTRSAGPFPFPLFFLFFLSFILPSCMGTFIVLLGVQDLPLVFSRCFVRIPFVDVFLMHLCGDVNSTFSYSAILTPPPLGLNLFLCTLFFLVQLWMELFCFFKTNFFILSYFFGCGESS